MAKTSQCVHISLTLVIVLLFFSWLGIQLSRFSILSAVIATFVLIADGLAEWFYVTFKTFPRDYQALKLFIRFRFEVHRFCKNGSIPDRFDRLVAQHPYRTCFIAEDKKWTYKEVDEFSNRIANIFRDAGLVHGDVVALFMESTPEFVCIWLGLAKLGVVSALINYNLRQQSFVHTVNSANSKAIIFGSALAPAVEEMLDSFTSGMTYYYYGEDGNGKIPFAKPLIDLIKKSKATKLAEKAIIKPSDRLMYIYTSGTTGLPKAAVITNLRYFFMASGPRKFFNFRDDDIIYEPLPVYHSAGGIMGIGQALCYGCTVVIKKKFSASKFWDDCIKDNCTISEYLGETCRYLLAQPPKPVDKKHKIRVMFGSGLRPQIWETFVKRFGIEQIGELYGSTEGNANIVNSDNKTGAVGFLPRSFPRVYPCILIKVDENTGIPVRDEDGVCVECKPGESGELVGKIIPGNPERNFDGYVSKEATNKKVVRDVFSKGDQAFLSGDILVMDRFGYLYFKDRTGDTFRWKSENVSTTEVEAVVSNHAELYDSVVYGVEVPNCEGRAGMAAILDPTNKLDLDKLYRGLVKELPSYARPQFIRITDSLPMTGTFKLKKLELQNDGFDPAKCGDHKLYYLNGNTYSTLTAQVYQDICSGKLKY